jgi:Sap, sulfolipid-1-addressing protein
MPFSIGVVASVLLLVYRASRPTFPVMGAEALANLTEDISHCGIRVALAHVHTTTAEMIRRSASDGKPGLDLVFPNLDSAVAWACMGPGRGTRRGGVMGQAIGGSLPLAVGIALSPIPIIAVVLMLTSHQAKVNGPAFLAGWLLGLGIVGAIVLPLAGTAGASTSGAPAAWVSWVKIALGLLLLLVAARQFRSRPRGDEQPQMPKWMATIDKTTPVAAVGLAAVLSGANPKNLLLAAGGAATIAQTGIPGGEQAIAYAVFALIGTLGVGIPVAIYVAMGTRSERLLAGLKDWMTAHNAVIMTVLCLIIATKLIGDAISGLTG